MTNDTIKYVKATELLQQWLDKQSHDRCWYYPDIFKQLCNVFDVVPTIDPQQPTRLQFEIGCRAYQEAEYGDKPAIEVDELRCGGKPVLPNSRFTLAQLVAELAEGRSLPDLCRDFNLSLEDAVKALNNLSTLLNK